ncbi:MAG: gliding motility-associated C-terminal domain-containing protein [Cytophagia bacterium]|nr:gliding motility-associated C-terminal domain-containing protein [Cytophagia bacterium]
MTQATFLRFLVLTILLGWSALRGWAQTYTIAPIPFAPAPYGGSSLTGQFSSADDGIAGPFPLGFSFCYFGNTYTQFWVGTNGWVSFSPGQPSTYTSAPIPSTNVSVPRNCVMGPWQDWWSNLNGNGNISYQQVGTYPNRKMVVSFFQLPMYQCTSLLGTFQIVLNECNNTIEVFIENKPNCTTWAGGTAVLGLHNATGTVAYVVNNTSIGQPPPVWSRNSTQWVVAPTTPGLVYPNASQSEGWLFSPVGQCQGVYFGGFKSIDTTSYWPVVKPACYTRQIGLKVKAGALTCNSIDTNGTDFRLYNPAGQLMQIRKVSYTCVNNRTDSVTVESAIDFLVNGDHYLVVRRGLDNNTLLGDCGSGAQEFDTIVVRLDDCYEYNTPVNMLNVDVSPDNQEVKLTWSTPVDFDTTYFKRYVLFKNDGLHSDQWFRFASVNRLSDTTLVTKVQDPTEGPRDFLAVLEMKYYGLTDHGDSVNNIFVQPADTTLRNGNRGPGRIRWTPYKAFENPRYNIYTTLVNDTVGFWVGSTTDTLYEIQKSTKLGRYRTWVQAVNDDSSLTAHSNWIAFDILDRPVVVYNVITPNGDGTNDFFTIKDLIYFPGTKVTIYDRWNQVVYNSDDYQNDWSPTDIPAGNYFYVVRVIDKEPLFGPLQIIK